MKHTIQTTCPICGKQQCIVLDDDQYDRYLKWKNHEMLIQDALYDLSADDRETLMTGICKDCWEIYLDDEDE